MRVKVFTSALIVFAAVNAVCAAEYELKWDTGKVGGWASWLNYGGGIWLGNEFDVSTLSTRYVDRIKIYSTPVSYGPWDGFRIAIWGFKGETPDEIIWPTSGAPKFVKGYGPRGWCEFDVEWTLPAGVETLVAAQEQFFASPYIDPYAIDDVAPKEPHTWHKTPRKQWYKYCPYGHTLMLRVIMEDDAAVAPTSLGRVKALYR